MHDDRVNCIIANAFNGFGDITGCDKYGVSVAWIDLDDHLDPEGLDNYEIYPYSDDISAYVKSHPAIDGKRYAIASWRADGVRDVMAFETEGEMRAMFISFRDDFEARGVADE